LKTKRFSVEKILPENGPFFNCLIISGLKNGKFLPIFALETRKISINGI